MRDIRFRAWDGEKMYYASLQDLIDAMGSQCSGEWALVDHVGEELAGFAGRLTYPCKQMIYMQYTGLTDRSGKDIYEGDIVKVPGNYISYGTHNAAIEWSDKELG